MIRKVKEIKMMRQTRVIIFLVILAFIGLGGKVQAQVQAIVVEDTTFLRGTKLAAKLEWLERNAESHNIYIVEVNANENITSHRILEYKNTINITIILIGDETNRTISLSSNGTMFTVKRNVTFILDNNITLQGRNQNTDTMVKVDGGIFKMNDGATIIGNKGGNGVSVQGTFEMTGGTILGNGTGVGVGFGTFIMNGGSISENADRGVYVGANGYSTNTFIMNGGTISGNTGGGVYNDGNFTMTGGTISGNTASCGGGVYVVREFNMRGGTISNNTATEYGGGVYLNKSWNKFTKTGGTITGYNSDIDNGNIVKDNNGVLARRGHAVFVEESGVGFGRKEQRRRESTAGSNVNLSRDNEENWN